MSDKQPSKAAVEAAEKLVQRGTQDDASTLAIGNADDYVFVEYDTEEEAIRECEGMRLVFAQELDAFAEARAQRIVEALEDSVEYYRNHAKQHRDDFEYSAWLERTANIFLRAIKIAQSFLCNRLAHAC